MDRVFVNRTLNLRKIKFIGLDMDCTTVRYHTKTFETLAYNRVRERLVREMGYPGEVLNLSFDFQSVIRGLVVDSVRGRLLKVSRHGAIRSAQHGTQKVSFQQQKKDYQGTYVDLTSGDFSSIDTSFYLSAAVLFTQLVDLKDKSPGGYPNYGKIFSDTLEAMDVCHSGEDLKGAVTRDLGRYIIQDPEVVGHLERYKRHGKKLFILTNSDYHYTQKLLDYAVSPFLKDHDSWQELFSYTITLAHKPRFFYDQSTSFLKVNPMDGSMTNVVGELLPGIYQGGCASFFEKNLKVQGEDILYVGDHIYGDIVRLKKACQWRTALVMEELEQEVEKIQEVKPLRDEIRKLMGEKIPLENHLVDFISREIEGGARETEKVAQLQTAISQIDALLAPLIENIHSSFNPNWGELMRAGNEESYFAGQVNRFADIYMCRLTDLLACSPRTYFRAVRRPLAHEVFEPY